MKRNVIKIVLPCVVVINWNFQPYPAVLPNVRRFLRYYKHHCVWLYFPLSCKPIGRGDHNLHERCFSDHQLDQTLLGCSVKIITPANTYGQCNRGAGVELTVRNSLERGAGIAKIQHLAVAAPGILRGARQIRPTPAGGAVQGPERREVDRTLRGRRSFKVKVETEGFRGCKSR